MCVCVCVCVCVCLKQNLMLVRVAGTLGGDEYQTVHNICCPSHELKTFTIPLNVLSNYVGSWLCSAHRGQLVPHLYKHTRLSLEVTSQFSTVVQLSPWDATLPLTRAGAQAVSGVPNTLSTYEKPTNGQIGIGVTLDITIFKNLHPGIIPPQRHRD